MAEPTVQQKIDAANAALAALDVSDADEARRAVAIFWSQVPLLPQPESAPPLESGSPELAAPDTFVPVYYSALMSSADPVMTARIKTLNEEALAITRELVAKEAKG